MSKDLNISYDDDDYKNVKSNSTKDYTWEMIVEDKPVSDPQKTEQKGLISRMWLWIKGLFGGDDV